MTNLYRRYSPHLAWDSARLLRQTRELSFETSGGQLVDLSVEVLEHSDADAAFTYEPKGRVLEVRISGSPSLEWRHAYNDAEETVSVTDPQRRSATYSRARQPDGTRLLLPVEPMTSYSPPSASTSSAASGPCLFGIFCFGKPPPPMCMGPSEEDALERCREAADGDDDDWENFCTANPWSSPVDMDRAGRCRRHAFSSPTEKKNFCYGEFGD